MNPKQIACLILMIFIGVIVYVAQIVHNKVSAMRSSAEAAVSAATSAETERSTAEIKAAMIKAETEEIRGFLKAWEPALSKAQTQTEVERTIEISLRDAGSPLVTNRRHELRTFATKGLPKSVLTTITMQDEYAKVLNWLGDIERRLPLTRMKIVRVSGGSTVRQLKLEASFETPLFDLNSVQPAPVDANIATKP
jgi:hypothetical protein